MNNLSKYDIICKKVCHKTILLKEEMGMALFHSDNPKEKEHKGILGAFSVDVIKWEPESDREASIIAHKFEYEDFPNGSYLIVGPSQMAVFTNNMSAGSSVEADGSGQAQLSIFTGPCKIKLETGDSRFAPFRNIKHSLTGGESAFHSTVYFINTTYMNELNWGTKAPVVVMDPEEEVNVHVRAFGLFGVHIEQVDSSISSVQVMKFLKKVVGTRADYTREELVDFMRAKILEYVPDLLAQNMIRKNIGILKISAYLREFSEIICQELLPHFNDFGLTLDNFSFHSINAPDEDLEAINQLKIEKKQARLRAEGNAVAMDIESEALARKRAREGYTYQQEQQFDVMQAAAENEGMSSAFMGAGIGLGMGAGIGGAFGNGMTSIAQNTMGNMQTPQMQSVQSNVEPVAICNACNTSNPAGAKFCLSCGERLQQPKAAPVCPACGQELVEGAKFCLNCGQKLSTACPGCGKELPGGAKFCPECGTKL